MTDFEKTCFEHMQQSGITGEKALKEQIKAIFAAAQHQGESLVGIYRMVLPEWERIERVHGYPEAGEALWQFICGEFIKFDHKHHPSVIAGGAWRNNGFSANRKLDPWQIGLSGCSVDYLEERKERQTQ
ncbi:MAG: hypothetical protein QMD09_10070 [Desulfatibacillaceae bacterium]|nr:hypothetical protein [Desulfatibacillaceae bacterium]